MTKCRVKANWDQRNLATPVYEIINLKQIKINISCEHVVERQERQKLLEICTERIGRTEMKTDKITKSLQKNEKIK